MNDTRLNLRRSTHAVLAAAAADLDTTPHALGVLLIRAGLAQIDSPSDDLRAAVREGIARLQAAGQV